MRPFWITAFLDLPDGEYDDAARFWSRVTGCALTPPRGEHDEFATLLPPQGDPVLKLQRLGHGESRLHLDLHAEDPRALAERAVGLGASAVADHGYVVLRSPGGLTFCCVGHPAGAAPGPAHRAGARSSAVDQVCLDLPQSVHDAEAAFWPALLDAELEPTDDAAFTRVRPGAGPLRLLLQRLDEPDGPARAHLDLSATDRDAEVARHEHLGARVLDRRLEWTVLAAPDGTAYCVTAAVPEHRPA